MAVVTVSEETTSPVAANRLFKALALERHIVVPKLMPQAFKSVQIVEGNGGVGTITKASFPDDQQMGCLTREVCGRQTLQELAKQLHFLTPLTTGTGRKLNLDLTDKNLDGICSKRESMDPFGFKEGELSWANWREKRAAVLICLFQGYEGELRVILTKRSMKLSCYPGDVALPGGKTEEGDENDRQTALREAFEEIGLDPVLVQVVLNLEPFITQYQLKVVPVVGLLANRENFKPILNIDEVDVIFDVPLEMFLKEENHRCEEKEWKGRKYAAHLFDYKCEEGDFLIWGLTASILIRAASVIYQRPPCFMHHLPDFQQLQEALCDEI